MITLYKIGKKYIQWPTIVVNNFYWKNVKYGSSISNLTHNKIVDCPLKLLKLYRLYFTVGFIKTQLFNLTIHCWRGEGDIAAFFWWSDFLIVAIFMKPTVPVHNLNYVKLTYLQGYEQRYELVLWLDFFIYSQMHFKCIKELN